MSSLGEDELRQDRWAEARREDLMFVLPNASPWLVFCQCPLSSSTQRPLTSSFLDTEKKYQCPLEFNSYIAKTKRGGGGEPRDDKQRTLG